MLFLALPGLPVRGEPGALHTFTNKKGNTVEAELLEVSRDRRTVRIRRADGAEFETEIVLFSLDDQQHIKDWLEEHDWEADYSLDLALAKKLDDTVKRRQDDLRIDTSRYRYEITLRNLTREALIDAKLRYALVREESVEPVERSDGNWSYRVSHDASAADSDGVPPPRIALRGEIALEDLAYNHEAALNTASAPLDKVADGSETLHEDTLLGVIVQVVSGTGEVLGEIHAGSAEMSRLQWEEIAGLQTEEAEEPNDDPSDLLSVAETE